MRGKREMQARPMTRSEHQGYTIHDLARFAGVSIETIRKYKKLRLLPPPLHGRTSNATYGAEHIRRLAELKKAKDQIATLEDLAERFANGWDR